MGSSQKENMSMKQEYIQAINTIGFLILGHKSKGMSEEQANMKTEDESDHYIRTHANAVTKLREIREVLENIYAERDYLEL